MEIGRQKFEYDRSSKWLIQHYGDSLLRLAGLRESFTWRPLQAEVVLPRQLPDGLLEVQVAGQDQPDLFVLEIATYPERRLLDQVLRDLMLVYLDRGVLPEVLSLILHPKGSFRPGDSLVLQSRRGWTQWQASWRVVELWTLPAEQLLAAHDVGLIPWVPLADFQGPPEPLLQQCRERIDQEAPPDEHANLLAVTQVLTRLKYNDPQLLMLFGGWEAMIESPLIQELLAMRQHKDILMILRTRFGPVPPNIAPKLQAIQEEEKLDELVERAASCRDLEEFRAHLHQ